MGAALALHVIPQTAFRRGFVELAHGDVVVDRQELGGGGGAQRGLNVAAGRRSALVENQTGDEVPADVFFVGAVERVRLRFHGDGVNRLLELRDGLVQIEGARPGGDFRDAADGGAPAQPDHRGEESLVQGLPVESLERVHAAPHDGVVATGRLADFVEIADDFVHPFPDVLGGAEIVAGPVEQSLDVLHDDFERVRIGAGPVDGGLDDLVDLLRRRRDAVPVQFSINGGGVRPGLFQGRFGGERGRRGRRGALDRGLHRHDAAGGEGLAGVVFYSVGV